MTTKIDRNFPHIFYFFLFYDGVSENIIKKTYSSALYYKVFVFFVFSNLSSRPWIVTKVFYSSTHLFTSSDPFLYFILVTAKVSPFCLVLQIYVILFTFIRAATAIATYKPIADKSRHYSPLVP